MHETENKRYRIYRHAHYAFPQLHTAIRFPGSQRPQPQPETAEDEPCTICSFYIFQE